MYSMIGKKGGKTVGIGRGGKNLIKKRKKLSTGTYIGKAIRSDYTRKSTSSSLHTRQLATAIWMIDILSIRVG